MVICQWFSVAMSGYASTKGKPMSNNDKKYKRNIEKNQSIPQIPDIIQVKLLKLAIMKTWGTKYETCQNIPHISDIYAGYAFIKWKIMRNITKNYEQKHTGYASIKWTII